jgi:hypothetical protein
MERGMIVQEFRMRLRLALVAAVCSACSCPPRPAAPPAPPPGARAPVAEGASAQAYAPADFARADHVHPPQDCILASHGPRPQEASLAITGGASVGSLEARSLSVKGTPVRLRGGRSLLDWDAAASGLGPRAPGGPAPRIRLEPGDPVEGDVLHVESGPGGADVVWGPPVPVSAARRYAARAAARLVSGDGTFALAFECLRADRSSIAPCLPARPAALEEGRWSEIEGSFEGEGEGPGRLPPGTAFVRPGFRANLGSASGGATRVARVELWELETPVACAWRSAAVEEDAPLAARCRPTEVAQGMRIQRRRGPPLAAAMPAADAEPTASLSLEILCCTLR